MGTKMSDRRFPPDHAYSEQAIITGTETKMAARRTKVRRRTEHPKTRMDPKMSRDQTERQHRMAQQYQYRQWTASFSQEPIDNPAQACHRYGNGSLGKWEESQDAVVQNMRRDRSKEHRKLPMCRKCAAVLTTEGKGAASQN